MKPTIQHTAIATIVPHPSEPPEKTIALPPTSRQMVAAVDKNVVIRNERMRMTRYYQARKPVVIPKPTSHTHSYTTRVARKEVDSLGVRFLLGRRCLCGDFKAYELVRELPI